MMKKMNGKTAVITGATSGIGLAIANLLVREGVFCYLVGRNFEQLKTVLHESDVGTDQYQLIRTDLSKESDLREMERRIEKREIDILIHCAGVIALDKIDSSRVEDLDLQYLVNLKAPYIITKFLLRKLKPAQGDIVFINSTAGLDAWENVGQYASTKHALRAMTDSLRKEISKDKIRVSSFYLGSVDTPMQHEVQKQSGNEKYDGSKFMKAEDIAKAVAFVLKLPSEMSVTDITIRQNT